MLDDFNRESLAVEANLNQPAPRVMRVFEQIGFQRARSERVLINKGPALVSKAFSGRAEDHDLILEIFRPGRPMQT